MATHTSILAWKIPWAEEPGGPWGRKQTQLNTCSHTHTHTHTHIHKLKQIIICLMTYDMLILVSIKRFETDIEILICQDI